MGNSPQVEAWQCLVEGKSLDRLPLQKKNGRVDLGGLQLPEPQIVRQYQTKLADVTETVPRGEFRNVKWRDLDFSSSRLNSLRFWDSEVVNCCFDHCQMQNLQPCRTTFRNCSFRKANLKQSGLGISPSTGAYAYGRNIYSGVDFTEADLRHTLYIAGAFEHCLFRNTKLVKLNFASTTFYDCRFEGPLREVLFWRSDLFSRPWLPPDAFPVNEMVDVDFSRASLRGVEFRGINLEKVKLPQDEDHIVIPDFAVTLDRLNNALKQQGDRTAQILVAGFEVDQRWAAAHSRGILNKRDLAEAGDGAVERVQALLEEFATRVQ